MRATSGKSGAQVLRERLKKPEILVAPGAYDCLSARLVERMGFEAAFMTGFGASAPGNVLFEHFGFTVDHVVEVAEGLLK